MRFVTTAALIGAMWIPSARLSADQAPPECTRFLGEWSTNEWDEPNSRATAISVKSVRKQESTCIAEVRYVWGEKGDSKLVKEAGFLDVSDSTIEGNVLTVPLTKYQARAKFTYDTTSTLKATWKRDGFSKTLNAIFKKK